MTREPAGAAPLGRADLAIAVALAALAAACIFPGLGTQALANWDEAAYGAIVRDFLGAPGLTMHYGAEPYYEKPPLLFWIMAGSVAAFGESEWSLRLPAAVAGVAAVVLTFLAGRRLGGRAAGVIAAALVLGVPQFLCWSRLAMMDVPLVALGMLAVVLVLYGEARRGLTVAAGAAFGLAIMTKSVAALLFAPGILALFVARRGARPLVSREALLALLAMVAVAAPWHAVQLAAHGRAFLDEYLLVNVIERLEHPLENHGGGPTYYLWLYDHNTGWLVYAHAAGVAAALAIAGWRRDATLAAVAVLALGAFFGVNAMGTKIGWYLAPVYPGAALAAGLAIARLVRPPAVRAAACAVALGLAVPGVLYGRGTFVWTYQILDFSYEVRALRGAAPFEARVPLLYVAWVSEPAPHFYLADRVETIDVPGLERLAASGAPFLCLTFDESVARPLLARHPGEGIAVAATTPSLAVLERK